jgi:cystathionine beta-lyase
VPKTTKPSLFDPPIERRASDSTKWSRFSSNEHDVIGAWIADMDLPTSDKIIDAIKDRLDERVFGYSEPPDQFFDVVMHRLEKKYGWKTKPEWFVPQPGVVPSLFYASNCLGDTGDSVMAARPNYRYFLETAKYTGRVFQPIDCHVNHDRWEMDFDQMRQTISSRTKAFLLCNPHNPVGRVLDQQELETIAEACLANGTMICSDEIHADLVLDSDKQHIPIASLDPEVEKKSITLISASKAFNLPAVGGLSLAIIPDPSIRAAFQNKAYGVATHPGALAYAATLTAFRDCDDWLLQTIGYLRDNRDYLEAQIASIDGLEMKHVEATFLAWIDVSNSGLENPVSTFLDHGVALSDGTEMGNADYVRLNFACHRSTLEEIVRRLKASLP